MNQGKQCLCLIALLALLSAVGCGDTGGGYSASSEKISSVPDSTQALDANTERLYEIPLSGNWDSVKNWVVDADGNEVTQQQDAAPDYTETDLTDLATGVIRYRFRTRDEIIRDEQGYPRTHSLCALYDLDGNQLTPWEEKDYQDAFGEYIIRQDSTRRMVSADDITDSYRTALYHVPTGTESYEGTHRVANLNNDAFLLIGNLGATIGVVNSAGKALTGIPLPKSYYSVSVWNGYITANSMNPNEQSKENRGLEYLLEFRDGNFHELLSAEWMSGVYGALRGDYIAYHNGDDWGIYQPEQGVVFTTDGASIEYYDGEIAIVQTGSYRGGDPVNAALVTTEHKELAGGFSWLIPVQFYEDKTPAQKFIGLVGGKAVLIDRTGNVLASSQELPELLSAHVKSVNMLCDGLYTYYAETDEFYGYGLLGPELEVLVPVGRYTSIDLAPGFYSENEEWDGTAETTLLRAGKEIGDSNAPGRTIYRMDILDHTGRVVADNVTDIYDVGPDRIALRRGFDIGLMDWDGNWIVKRRIFTGFGDD